ncbi:MAG: hypothetical protein P1U57_03400, partial [Oleibacter sp.]|nr:hypothetical protein [Thalassolituus sp.]
MSPSQDILHILFVTRTPNDAEYIAGVIRNSGWATRVTHVNTHAAFEEALHSSYFDIIVAEPNLENTKYTELLNQVARVNKDIPLVLIPKDYDTELTENAFLSGVAGIIPIDQTNSLCALLKREVKQLRLRQELRLVKVELRDTEKRCRVLLENSEDAIAYIYEGMHLYANHSYLELFELEDIDGLPALDVITTS